MTESRTATTPETTTTEPDEITMLLETIDGLLDEGAGRRHVLAATAVLLTLEPTAAELMALEDRVHDQHRANLAVTGFPRQPGTDWDQPDVAFMAGEFRQVRDRRLAVIQLAAEARRYEAASAPKQRESSD